MGSGRTFDNSGESEGTGVRVLSCVGEGRTGGGGLRTTTLHSTPQNTKHHTTTTYQTEEQSGLRNAAGDGDAAGEGEADFGTSTFCSWTGKCP